MQWWQQFSLWFYTGDFLQVFYMAFQKFTRLPVPFALSFRTWKRTITTYRLTSWAYLSLFQQINTLLKIPLVLQTGKNDINTIIMCFSVSVLCFSNVPLSETLQICIDKLFVLPNLPALPRPAWKKLLEFATKKSHFIFYGQYYEQIDSIAMFWLIFSCAILKKMDKDVLILGNTRRSGIDMLMARLPCLTLKPDTANEFLKYLNTRHISIKFPLNLNRAKRFHF